MIYFACRCAILLTIIRQVELATVPSEIGDAIIKEASPKWEDVQWDFANGEDKWLSDGDHIVMKKDCQQGVANGHVRFGLVCSGTWWKAITVHSNHFLYELVAVQDAPGVIKYADIDGTNLELYNFVLSKAKIFGIHTDMYKIANIVEAESGCAYIFQWLQD